MAGPAAPARPAVHASASIETGAGEIFRHWITLILSDRDATRTVNAASPNAVDISSGTLSVRLEFDETTGLPIRQIYKEGPSDVKETFSD